MDPKSSNIIPFLALNKTMKGSYREIVVKRALNFRKEPRPEAQGRLEEGIRNKIHVKGSQDPLYAPPSILLGKVFEESHNSNELMGNILKVWVLSQENLANEIREYLKDRGSSLQEIEKRWEGFLDSLSNAEMTALANDFLKMHPSYNFDDVALMICCQKWVASSKEDEKNGNPSAVSDFVELKDQLTSLKEKLSKLAERLDQAAKDLKGPGRISADGIVEEIGDCQKNFIELRVQVLKKGDSLNIPGLPEFARVNSLEDLETLVVSFSDIGGKRKAFEEAKNRGCMVLDRVLAVGHRDHIDFPPLSESQTKARELRQAIEGASWPDLHPDTDALTNGSHPFSDLLTLIESPTELDDLRWGLVHDSVEQNFGKVLAVAASRGKLIISPEPMPKKSPRLASKKEPNLPMPSVVEKVGADKVVGDEAAPRANLRLEGGKKATEMGPDVFGDKQSFSRQTQNVTPPKEKPISRGEIFPEAQDKTSKDGGSKPGEKAHKQPPITHLFEETSEAIAEFIQKLTSSPHEKKKS